MQSDLFDAVDEQRQQVIQVLAGFKPVCEPCAVGITRPFKMRLAEMCQAWKVSEYSKMGRPGKISTPTRGDLLKSLDATWNEFDAETIKNSFRKNGFTGIVNLS